MSDAIGADDLEMLATGFQAAMQAAPGSAEADHAIFDLGWGELLAAAPTAGAATAFAALGSSGAAACLLDDVIGTALGVGPAPETCVAMPPPHRASVPATRSGDAVRVDGLVSARIDRAAAVLLPVEHDGSVEYLEASAATLRGRDGEALDPDRPYRRAIAELQLADVTPTEITGSWDDAVRGARVALAHQLIGAAQWMLDEARQHALDRVQFGRPIASFQAVRHKLAESLVQIEGAASVASACTDDSDPMLAALAKSLAGRAARTTAGHAQQVLAGIGFTSDHRFHRWLKRTLVVDALFGSASSLPTEIGRDLLARGSAPRLVEL